jgi:hypothetical protein
VPCFADRLSQGDAAALHAFIVDRATQAAAIARHDVSFLKCGLPYLLSV